MNNQAATGWGEIPKTEPELNIPGCMNRPKFESLDEMQKHDAKTRRWKWQHIKNRIMTGAWALTTIGMGIALIVWG